MSSHRAAIGRNVGKVDTDAGGLARYSLKIQLPPGIRPASEPELSLEYSQGASNGSVGVGWALGGISCIRRAPSSLPYDAVNPPPSNYDRSKPKLTLDGAELLHIEGEYGASNARYMTELEQSGRVVTTLGRGFVSIDSSGARAEYGTTEDSRVLDANGETREWRMKTSSDYHGNTNTYNYVVSPEDSSGNVNTCYLDSIRYSSNAKTGFKGGRIVKFEFSQRPDVLLQKVHGIECVWTSLLTAIRCGVIQGGTTQFGRAYELNYAQSAETGDSCLVSVTETAFDGAQKVELLPSRFEYSRMGLGMADLFRSQSQQLSSLRATTNNVTLFSMNISGRCLADVAVVRFISNRMSIKTYLATRGTNGRIDWVPSDGVGAEAVLPAIDFKAGFPDILSPDLNNDGRADFVVPYPDSNDNLQFSISQCIGTGFQDARTKTTSFKWTTGSKFMAIDNPGQSPSIVQMFADREKLSFRNFASFSENGKIGLRDATTTSTKYTWSGTIDWVQLSHAGTGAKSIVRIWGEELSLGRVQMKATVFTIGRDSSIKEGVTSSLGEPTRLAGVKYSVLSCDINADGAQDILLATTAYSNNRMSVTVRTFLGDGYGSFKSSGSSITKDVIAPMPMKTADFGQFYVTNLNGSNYPSLSYVYRAKFSRSYACITVDGRSDGQISNAICHELGKDLPGESIQVSAVDLNGNGMGDWLFWTIDAGIPKLAPVYNNASVVDFLSSAEDSMGLKTSITYGCMSDPEVYTPGVDWKQYTSPVTDSYPVIAAPNYVVTSLEHRNNPLINSIDYRVLIKKTYSKARINWQGRGWQGFQEVHTLNVADGILTTETYHQSWPLTGMKQQIDTKSIDGEIAKSVRTTYKISSKAAGPWKIFRSDTVLEESHVFSDGAIARSHTVLYEYDDKGNAILQSPSESQKGRLMHQCWKRCAYTTIDGVTNVLVAEKVSSNSKNVDMTRFELGDMSFTVYENHANKAVLRNMLSWSDEAGQFARKSYVFDDYGRETLSVDASGLQKTTTYDEVLQTHRTKVVEQGPGVLHTELTAFDLQSGQEAAVLETNGLLTCYKIDGFGRTVESRSRATLDDQMQVSSADFFAQSPFVADKALTDLLGTTRLHPQRRISFERQTSSKGQSYIGTKIVTMSKPGVEGEHEVSEYVDCVKQVRKRIARDGNNADKTWVTWDYDSRGQPLFESFPVKVSPSVGLDWSPNNTSGIRSVFDILGRPVSRVRPCHGDKSGFIVSTTNYLDGGSRARDVVLSASNAEAPFNNVVELASSERRTIRVGKEELVIEKIDENGLRATFQYDVSGNMISCTDAASNVERRTYSSQGDLVTLDNVYQNPTQGAGTLALKYKHDASRRLISAINAAAEEVKYGHDAKGRTLLKTGSDGRTLRCVYDQHGLEGLSSVEMTPRGASKPESRLEFTYDHAGRVKSQISSLSDGNAFLTTFKYDWQGQLVEKVLPGGVVLRNVYLGSEVIRSGLSGGPESPWNLQAETSAYSAFGRPEALELSGSGLTNAYTHKWKYDSQGFPLAHSLELNSQALVDQRYLYNDMDQLARAHDFLSGQTTDYKYQGRRLLQSQTEAGTASYTYDAAGNITLNRNVAVAYNNGRAVGTKAGTSEQVFDVAYDAAGRTMQRQTADSSLTFAYDSFGALSSIQDSKKSSSISIIADHEGSMLQRKHSDGSLDLFLDDDVSMHIQVDGSKVMKYTLLNHNEADNKKHYLATVSIAFESAASTRQLSGIRKLSLHFTDTKGNVTHIYDGKASLSKKLTYDDFGLLGEDLKDLDDDACRTYEGTFLDSLSGLLNFGGRWYDPMVCRFTTPDDIVDLASLLMTDGMNRLAFEGNDPINNTDPTGHWTWSSIFGVIIGALLIVAAVAVTIATGGAGGVLVGALTGALAGGGIAGIQYSIKNKDEQDAGRFWGGFATTVALNAAIGAAAGAAGAVASPARMASAYARLAIRALAGGATSVLQQAADRGVDNLFYGKHYDLFEGAALSFLTGAVMAGAIGAATDKFGARKGNTGPNKLLGINKFEGNFKLRAFTGIRQVLEPKPTNPWAGLTKEVLKLGAKEVGKPLAKIGAGLIKDAHKK